MVINDMSYVLRALSRGKWKAVDDDDDDEDVQIQPHVLVVDDERIFRVVHSAMFREHSCKVTTAGSGLQALTYFGLVDDKQGHWEETPVEKVNLICSDYYMPPGMTGYELLKIIKESDATKNVPVVIVASDVETPRINECMEAGAVMFVEKPLKSADVEHLVKLMNVPAR